MLRSVALFLAGLATVQGAGHVGSVDVSNSAIEWTIDGVVFDISARRSSNGGDPLYDPREIEFRLPTRSRARQALTTVRLARKRNNRVKNIRVNGSTFKVKYNKKGKKVVRIRCSRGPACGRRLSEESVYEEVPEEVPAHRKTQEEAEWSCNSCGDFWESMCDDRGISLLCDEKGIKQVDRVDERQLSMAVDTLCDAVVHVCEEIEEDGSDETCFFSFEADLETCDVFIAAPTSEPTPGPTAFPTSAPTPLDEELVAEAVEFVNDISETLFGEEDSRASPVFELEGAEADGSASVGGSFNITSPSGEAQPLVIDSVAPVDTSNPPQTVTDNLPDTEPLTQEQEQLLDNAITIEDISATAGTGDNTASFGALSVAIDIGDGVQSIVAATGDLSIFDSSNLLGSERRLTEDTSETSIIHSRALALERDLQANNKCMMEVMDGAEAAMDRSCPDGQGARVDSTCVELAFSDSGAEAAIIDAAIANENRLAAGIPSLDICLSQALFLRAIYAGAVFRFCAGIAFFPGGIAATNFFDALNVFAICWNINLPFVIRYGLDLSAACVGRYEIDVRTPSERQLAEDEEAACVLAREYVAEQCSDCVPLGSLTF